MLFFFFLEELVCCTKTKAKIMVKQGTTPVFKPKQSVPFLTIDPVNKEQKSLSIVENNLPHRLGNTNGFHEKQK